MVKTIEFFLKDSSQSFFPVQGDYVGYNTGNGEKLSSWPGLALLCCSLVSLHFRF